VAGRGATMAEGGGQEEEGHAVAVRREEHAGGWRHGGAAAQVGPWLHQASGGVPSDDGPLTPSTTGIHLKITSPCQRCGKEERRDGVWRGNRSRDREGGAGIAPGMARRQGRR
jgi:hypothetical protein